MRILHVLDHSLPLHSGYSFRTVAILREQRSLGWDTLHLTTPRHGASAVPEESVDGWTFHRTLAAAGVCSRLPVIGNYLEEMRATARRIDELARIARPDVIHAHSPVLNALPALWVGRRLRIPVVYEMRASWEDAAVDHGDTVEGSLRYRLSRALETFALKRADQVTTICDGLRRDILSRGVAGGRVTVIPNAVDAEKFVYCAPLDEGLRDRLGLREATVIGFAGSFYGYEGLDLLLEAAARLAPRDAGVRVLLIGGGPQESALKAQAQRLGLGGRVIFTGRVPHAEVSRYYSLVDLLVYPRHSIRLTEVVTPLKPLEAMAQGCVLIASDVGGHRELIRDRETGFLFPAGDADTLARKIEDVLEQRVTWNEIRQQARRFVEAERTWARSVSNYAGVYRRAIGDRLQASPAATAAGG